jgi:hypothetical protein
MTRRAGLRAEVGALPISATLDSARGGELAGAKGKDLSTFAGQLRRSTSAIAGDDWRGHSFSQDPLNNGELKHVRKVAAVIILAEAVPIAKYTL